MANWDIVLQENQGVPSPGGEQRLQRYEDKHRVAAVWEEAAGQITEEQLQGLKVFVANQLLAKLEAHAGETGTRLNHELEQYANRYQDNPWLHRLNAQQAQQLMHTAHTFRMQNIASGQEAINEVIKRSLRPKEKGFWARLFGG